MGKGFRYIPETGLSLSNLIFGNPVGGTTWVPMQRTWNFGLGGIGYSR